MKAPPHLDRISFPETALRERFKLAYDWIPAGCRRLLDAGCSYGYGTRHFKAKAGTVCGVDPNPELIAIARARYSGIRFEQSGAESIPFESDYFDVVVLNEVIEHVRDEVEVLDEVFRVLRPGGSLIVTTPHRGLFGFMDPDNYVFHLRTRCPCLYRRLYQAKYGRPPADQIKPGYDHLHHHYRLGDLRGLLDRSRFRGCYTIDRVRRSGLLAFALGANCYELVSLLVGCRWALKLTRPLGWLADIDYLIPYGLLAYNIAIRVRKEADHRAQAPAAGEA